MLEDLRYALRQLRKNPGFAALAVATLGFGIGAAAAMFGLIQGVLLSPPPYAEPDRLVLLDAARLDGQPYTLRPTTGHWVAWRQARAFEAPAVYRWTFNFLVRDDGSESLGGMVVSTNYFRVLGVKPILGRDFLDTEAQHLKTPPTAIILGYDLWKRKFNSDSNIIGKSVRLSRMPAALPVVGVMPPGLRFLPDPGAASEPNYDLNAHVDFWLAMAPDESRPKSSRWKCCCPAPEWGIGQPGAGGGGRDWRRARRLGFQPAGPDGDGNAGSRRAESRRASAARAAVRLGRARVPHRLRQRRRASTGPRASTATGIRDAFGPRRRSVAALPTGDQRERRVGAGQRRHGRGTGGRDHRHPEGDRRPGNSTVGRRQCRLASFRIRVHRRAAGVGHRRRPSGDARVGSRSAAEREGHPQHRRPARNAGCSAPWRHSRLR